MYLNRHSGGHYIVFHSIFSIFDDVASFVLWLGYLFLYDIVNCIAGSRGL